ncbi:hypothetical protein ASG43_14240 [Aureimonas sp. Leaf454]|uniref:type II toxin-antitoxin system VapC family toxin n=1 Tax=Aureimonas sp. Leaf454 TaxID=1736381 RepID=UPI0006FDC330|nr:PIN domain-containing protein [Aureimonas sp. Leaf454]KQT44492.1 hypothetical protein ASG43_14240 [Aureimonas sp. Leaf454]
MASVYVDTNAVIRLVEEGHAGLRELFAGGRDEASRLVTSELTPAEVLVGPLQAQSTRLLQVCETLLADPIMIQTVPIDRSVPRKSAQIKATFGGKLPDAIHIATALLSGGIAILSSDRRRRMPAELRRIDIEAVDKRGEWS